MGGLALDLFCVLVGQIINIVYNHLDIDKVKIRCVRQNKCYTFIRGKRHTKWLHLYSFGRSVEKLNVCVIILNWAFIPLQILHYLNSFFFLGIAHFWHRINLRPATHTFYSWPKCKVCTIMLPTIPDSQHLSPNPWEFQLSVPIPARNEAGIPGAGHVVISGARHRRR